VRFVGYMVQLYYSGRCRKHNIFPMHCHVNMQCQHTQC